ncbi:hypothetical protein EXIGLDRAFT_32947 [Exidia glandulosa HHB12029]|uniref:Uncharacterized protein n=1 Tax=Exidia glandulosa HHB12029 TaxID=1314781 RepID=A0A165ISH4_EXIGL|nr:hypothetical protein EXIGLDRAFT_32947 [Exidia glandulosa HHB12029]
MIHCDCDGWTLRFPCTVWSPCLVSRLVPVFGEKHADGAQLSSRSLPARPWPFGPGVCYALCTLKQPPLLPPNPMTLRGALSRSQHALLPFPCESVRTHPPLSWPYYDCGAPRHRPSQRAGHLDGSRARRVGSRRRAEVLPLSACAWRAQTPTPGRGIELRCEMKCHRGAL